MPSGIREKLIYILEILKKTDEDHPVNTTDILRQLKLYGIEAERKSVSRDIGILTGMGYSIITCPETRKGYYMTDQLFESYELKLITDAVCQARFLTVEDTQRLLKKLRSLATKGCEEALDAMTYIDPGIKSKNNRVRYAVDKIITAITKRKKITFRYFEYVAGNRLAYKRDGHIYRISPYYLVWRNEEYFLIGNPDSHGRLTHFRVEMMADLEISDEPRRPAEEIEDLRGQFDPGEYIRRSVDMFTGDKINVTLRCSNIVRQEILRRFGSAIAIRDDGTERFIAHFAVNDTIGLRRFLLSFDPELLRLESPAQLKAELLAAAEKTAKAYRD